MDIAHMAVRILQTSIAAIAFLTSASGGGGIALADPSPAPSPAHAGSNAADYYKQAIALYGQMPSQDREIFRNQAPQPDATKSAALHATLQPIIDLIMSARNADYTDWGPAPVSTVQDEVRSRDLMGLQGLTYAIRWEAAACFQSDPAKAVNLLAAQVAMGRGDLPNAIGIAVEVGVEMSAVKLLERNVAAIPIQSAADVAFITDPAAARQCFEKGMTAEAAIHQAHLDEYANPATRKGSEIQKYLDSKPGIVESPEEIISEAKWLGETEEALSKTYTLTETQYQQWWKPKLAQAAAMPAVIQASRALDGTNSMVRIAAVETAMLNAALAMKWNDAPRFATILDPSTGKPFAYSKTATGFEISSPMLNPYGPKQAGSPQWSPLDGARPGGKPIALSIPESASN